jgi:hypothetical protein
MLPMEEFDAPEAVRSDFAILCTRGAAADRFNGVPVPQLTTVEHAPGGFGEPSSSAWRPRQLARPLSTSHSGHPLMDALPGSVRWRANAPCAG